MLAQRAHSRCALEVSTTAPQPIFLCASATSSELLWPISARERNRWLQCSLAIPGLPQRLWPDAPAPTPRRHPGHARSTSRRLYPLGARPARSNMHVALLGHILAVQWCIGTCNYVMFTTYIWPRKIKTKCRRYASQSWSACRAAPAAQRCPRRPVAHVGKRAW